MKKPALLLLPNLLGEHKYHEIFLPSSVAKAMASIDGLIAESESGGRRFLKHFQTKKKNILSDLVHIRKTLKGQNEGLVVRMPVCKKCGFIFRLNSVREPSKCPQCNSTWIEPPTYKVI